MEMNKNKTKMIIVNRQEKEPLNIKIGSKKIQKFKKLKYLENKITNEKYRRDEENVTK